MGYEVYECINSKGHPNKSQIQQLLEQRKFAHVEIGDFECGIGGT